MKKNKQNPDFLNFGIQLLDWYSVNGRDLPFRKTKNPYKIWICEIVFQQTRIQQGLEHYNKFILRFPRVEDLANAHVDEVLLYWKGLGYYSRAINLHKAAQQIINDFNGVFPNTYEDIIQLKGVGKYTASAIASICFNENRPAIDGNFYRILSRFFGDDFDISNTKAFEYFSNLAFRIMPENKAGDFNQAIMDIGSEICKPKNPLCDICPISKGCIAFQTGKTTQFPVKIKKVKVKHQKLDYYYLYYQDYFLIRQRDNRSIWKRLYEFSTLMPQNTDLNIIEEQKVNHILTHIKMEISFFSVEISSLDLLKNIAQEHDLELIHFDDFEQKSFPKPIESFLKSKIKC
ncbi:MAG: A/G-specific adenine glycosylase [Flavobacteriales bacterium]|nr:MAG: A/G-specific adenine glycosylase [Flavobacteriales bacterium]